MTQVRIEFDIADTEAVQRVHNLLGKLLGPGPLREEPQPSADPSGGQATDPPAKRTRRTKAEIEAAKAPADPAPVQAVTPAPQPVQAASFEDPPVPSASPSFLDDDEPVKVTTKDDVRAALVALQMKRTGVYVQGGKSEKDAAAAAEADARAVIVRIGGTDRLGTLDEKKYGAVVKAANEEAAK
jgi:hypothetical protein